MKYLLFNKLYIIAGAVVFMLSCGKKQVAYDATGVFEAQEVVISAEAAGVLEQFNISEGQVLRAGQEVGSIDCDQIGLQKDQISATESALRLRQMEAGPQVKVLVEQIALQESQIITQREQWRVMQVEQLRLQKLVAAQAAPSKQLDDINGQMAVLEKQISSAQKQIGVLRQQIAAQEQTAAIANRGIMSETKPLGVRKAQLDDQMKRCKVVNPLNGTVLTKYAEAFEMAAPGKALYKVANLDTLTLRAYITGEQLPNVRLGQTVQVLTGENASCSGTITWISDKAEFTPKSIQTREERANLVYAVKIKTPNNGALKIGMFGDVKFDWFGIQNLMIRDLIDLY